MLVADPYSACVWKSSSLVSILDQKGMDFISQTLITEWNMDPKNPVYIGESYFTCYRLFI